MERTLIIIKPDAVQRGLIGEIIDRFERRGLRIAGMKLMQIDTDLASRHYAEHEGKPFYAGLLEYITSGPVVVMALEGKNAIAVARHSVGKTDPLEAAPGSIRGDFGIEKGRNLVHGSDKPESAAREIDLFFTPDELLDWTRETERWVYEG